MLHKFRGGRTCERGNSAAIDRQDTRTLTKKEGSAMAELERRMWELDILEVWTREQRVEYERLIAEHKKGRAYPSAL